MGSTKSVKEQKKKEENWTNKRQNITTTRISTITCSNNTDQHTEEEGRKTNTKGQRKPKMDVKEYQRKETSITYSKTNTEIRNNKESEEEIKSPKTTLRNTNTNNKNKNKTNSADNVEDKTSKKKLKN
jgi:hypothetical protein